MASLALGVKFIPTAGGAGDFTYLAQVGGYVSPTDALVDGKSYRYRAENSTLTEWEFGTGTWSSSVNTLSRDTIAASSTGSKVTFTAAPQIGIVIFPEDVLTPDDNLKSVKNADEALDNLGGTATGKALFTSEDADAALDNLGGTATGKALFTSADADAALDNLGGTATGKALFTSTDADAALDNLGGTATGKALFTSTDADAALDNLGGNLAWYARGIGEIVYIDTSITGVSIPPQAHPDLVYIELTAGLDGAGEFNEGKLTSESVTGSAPLVVATAIVDVSGSPINGETIHLLNTEEAILRPRASGVGSLQQDQMQQITGSFEIGVNYRIAQIAPAGAFSSSKSNPSTAGNQPGPGAAGNIQHDFNSANSPGARAGTETRMKNIGVTAYMRVK